MGIISWLFNKSVESFARNTAKTQLATLYTIKKKNPELEGENLYEQVIVLRPSYDLDKAREIIKKAKSSFEKYSWTNKAQKFCFRNVVSQLIINEYFNTCSPSLKNDVNSYTIIEFVVQDVIPAEL